MDSRSEKRRLVNGLLMQLDVMRENAALMRKIYGRQSRNHVELFGAAKITDKWVDQIVKEIE